MEVNRKICMWVQIDRGARVSEFLSPETAFMRLLNVYSKVFWFSSSPLWHIPYPAAEQTVMGLLYLKAHHCLQYSSLRFLALEALSWVKQTKKQIYDFF